MSGKYNVSQNPHVRDKSSTSRIMLDVCIALMPACAFGVYNFGGWHNGIDYRSTAQHQIQISAQAGATGRRRY